MTTRTFLRASAMVVWIALIVLGPLWVLQGHWYRVAVGFAYVAMVVAWGCRVGGQS